MDIRGLAALLYSHNIFFIHRLDITVSQHLLPVWLVTPLLRPSEGLYPRRPLQNQALTQLPEAGGAALVLRLRGRQATEAVVEVHAAQPLQFRSRGAVHRGGRALLLRTEETQEET